MMLGSTALLLQLLAATAPQDAKLLRDARAAQARFEQVRRMHLPRDRWGAGGAGGRCDAQIGRYCYWYGSTESPDEPVPEPREIVDARNALIHFLDSAAVDHPSEGWLAGQRVRYLIEGGHPDDAADAALDCRAERWWCTALTGLALHAGERYASADSSYQIALAEMPVAQRCEWLDLRKVLDDQLEREMSRANCAEREQLANTLWTLSQPLWSTAGNDLRTEHFARLTLAAILTRTANAFGMSFGDDSRELLLRYGWSEWFSRADPSSSLYASPTITGHDREPSYYFYPSIKSARRVPMPRLTAEAWDFRLPIARTRYSPRHVMHLSALPHQLGRFPRGDSTLIAVAFAVRDTGLERDSLVPFLAVLQHDGLRVGDAHAATLWLTIADDTAIASIEVQGARSKRVARARYTIDPLMRSGGFSLSDLLLFDPARYAGADLEPLVSEAFTDAKVSGRAPLGVYWELQGIPSSEPVWLNVTVEPTRVSFSRRAATRLHLAAKLAPVRLRWQGVLQRAREGQSVTLRMPSGSRGRYRVLLTVEPPGAATHSTRSGRRIRSPSPRRSSSASRRCWPSSSSARSRLARKRRAGEW